MNSLFLAKVVNVYPKRKVNKKNLNNNIEAEVQHETYTIDVQPFAGRLQVQNVRVLSNNSGTLSTYDSGHYWMPDIGDWVVCGYLEQHKDLAICFGTIKHPLYNKTPVEAQGYQDYVMFHQSGSYIRMRDLEKYDNPSNNQTRSEMLFHHKSGAELEFCEVSQGQVEITMKHPTGASVTIDRDGAISIGGPSGLEPFVLGDKFKSWFTGEFMSGLGTLQVMTGMGPSGPLAGFGTWSSFSQQVSSSIDNIFSEKNTVS